MLYLNLKELLVAGVNAGNHRVGLSPTGKPKLYAAHGKVGLKERIGG
jgi:hypothetical protein